MMGNLRGILSLDVGMRLTAKDAAARIANVAALAPLRSSDGMLAPLNGTPHPVNITRLRFATIVASTILAIALEKNRLRLIGVMLSVLSLATQVLFLRGILRLGLFERRFIGSTFSSNCMDSSMAR